MKKILITAASILMISSGCNQKFTTSNLPTEFMEIGNGSGFTGSYTYYKVAKNGQVFFSQTGDSVYSNYGEIGKRIAKKAYKDLGKLRNEPSSQAGNLNFFIFRAEKDTMTSWLWSDDKKPSEGVLRIYKTLNEEVSKIKETE